MSDLRAALEASLAENPDDLATHVAYADYLMEQGDPRGEFIQVQLRLEDASLSHEQREHLQFRELELLEAHERAWLGDLAEHVIEKDVSEYQRQAGHVNHCTWFRGWLDEVCFWYTELPALRALAKSPIARLLTRLDLGDGGYVENGDAEPDDNLPAAEGYTALYVLLKAPFLPHVRFFRRGEKVDFANEYHNCTIDGDGIVELAARMPRLEELQSLARGAGMRELFALPNLTRLRTLVVYHEREIHPLDVLANNPALTALETLRLHPGHSYEPGYLPLEAVAPLFTSPHLKSLRHLHLYASSMGDAGCAELVRSGMLRRLTTLDLEHGCITDAGARILANSPDTRRLRCLSVANNQLTDAGIALLGSLGIPEFHSDRQANVGDEEYLWTGDME